MVTNLVRTDQNQWYSQYKRLTNQGLSEKLVVDEINHLTDEQQGEKIADNIKAVSQEYDHLKMDDINTKPFTKSSIPHITGTEVLEKLKNVKAKKSTAPGDVPAKLIKSAAVHLAVPLNDVIRLGQLPDIYKLETITPVPKVQPVKTLEDSPPTPNMKASFIKAVGLNTGIRYV